MGRRTVLLIVAALIAALGTSLVLLYVRGADNRAQAGQDPVQVLKAIEVINPGETLLAAQTAGKIELGTVPSEQVLSGAVNSTSTIGDQVALSTIYPNEQIISAKFGAPGDQKVLTIPDGQIAISLTTSDTGRVAGFVSPGAEVAIFLKSAEGVRLLIPRIGIIAVGTTTVVPLTTTTAAGAQTTEQLPKTLFTVAADQADAERIMFAVGAGELTFALLTEESIVKPGPGTNDADLFR